MISQSWPPNQQNSSFSAWAKWKNPIFFLRRERIYMQLFLNYLGDKLSIPHLKRGGGGFMKYAGCPPPSPCTTELIFFCVEQQKKTSFWDPNTLCLQEFGDMKNFLMEFSPIMGHFKKKKLDWDAMLKFKKTCYTALMMRKRNGYHPSLSQKNMKKKYFFSSDLWKFEKNLRSKFWKKSLFWDVFFQERSPWRPERGSRSSC